MTIGHSEDMAQCSHGLFIVNMCPTCTLEEQVLVVAEARKKVIATSIVATVAFAEWQTNNKSILDAPLSAKAQAVEDEALLRELTLKAYKETGNKHPAPGVGINVTTTYEYAADDALAWAKDHNLALSLDKSAFEKIAKADTPSFVKVDTNVVKATIATNLDEALKS